MGSREGTQMNPRVFHATFEPCVDVVLGRPELQFSDTIQADKTPRLNLHAPPHIDGIKASVTGHV